MKKVSITVKFLIKFALIFALLFVWLRFFIKSTWLSCVIAILATLLLQGLIFMFTSKKKGRIYLKSQEEEDAQNMFFSLANSTNPVEFFSNLVKCRHQNITSTKSFILIEHFNKKTTILYPQISFKLLDEDNLISIIKEIKPYSPDKLVITCGEYNKNILKFVQSYTFEIVILDKFQTYSLLYKEYEFFPQITDKYKNESKTKLSQIFSNSFNRSKSKAYIFSAFALFILSFFVKLSIYYYVIISILLLLSFVSLANTKYNIKTNKELL